MDTYKFHLDTSLVLCVCSPTPAEPMDHTLWTGHREYWYRRELNPHSPCIVIHTERVLCRSATHTSPSKSIDSALCAVALAASPLGPMSAYVIVNLMNYLIG